MRTYIVAVGLILILSGLIVFSFHNVPQERVTDENSISVEGSWKISRDDYKAGDNLSVGFVPGSFWGWLPHESTTINGIYYTNIKVYFIRVIDGTTGDYTEFNVTLGMPTTEPYSPEDVGLLQLGVFHHGALIVEDTPREIGGIVKHNGTYSVESDLYPMQVYNITEDESGLKHTSVISVDPPGELRLYRIIKETEYPYKIFLFLGPLIVGTGVVTLILGVRKEKPRLTHKKAGSPTNVRTHGKRNFIDLQDEA